MSWQPRRLADCAKLLSGGTPKKSRAEFWDGDIPWVSSGEMTESFINDTSLHVTEDGAKNGTRRIPAGTILVVVRGMSLAKEFRISMTMRDMTFNQDLKALACADDVHPKFLFYALKARKEAIRDAATDASHGTKKLDTDALLSVELPFPETLEEQIRVAEIASAYDDLIENNRRRIALLEQAARLLYREWFVHFRFPGYETAKFIDGLPEGWGRQKVMELTQYISRGITPKYDPDGGSIVINQKCIRDNRAKLHLARKQSKPIPAEKRVRRLDVLVNSTGKGTLGRVAQFQGECSNLTVDSHVSIVRASETIDPFWFGAAMIEREVLIETLGRGSTSQTELSKDDLGRVELTVPKISLQVEFGEKIAATRAQVEQLLYLNDKLAKARDLLLPRLMDGRLPVPE